MVKQVIVMRTDLNMRKGKMVAQGAHASMKALLDQMQRAFLYGTTMSYVEYKMNPSVGSPLHEWLDGKFTKICVGVGSEKELLDIYYKAFEMGLICSLIQDSGATEFGGVPTYTCVAVGPESEKEIDVITGHLKLL